MKIKKILIIIGICLASIGLLSCSILLFDNNNSNNSSGSSSSDEEIYTVTYDGNGATLLPVAYTRFKDYNKVNLVTPAKTGYTFDGWYEGDTKVEKITENRDYNLTARFNIINYSITYVFNGGEVNTGIELELPFSYTINSDDILFEGYEDCLLKEGYVFDGFYLDSNFSERCNIIRNGNHEDITLYVKWIIPPTNVTYVLNNHGIENRAFTVDKSNNLNVITENDIPYQLVEPICTTIAVNFLGWFDSENNKVEQITELSKDLVLTAKFEPRDIDIVFTWSPTGDKNDMFGTITRNIDSEQQNFMSLKNESGFEDVQWDTTNDYGHIISWTMNSEYDFLDVREDYLRYSVLECNVMSKNLGDEVIVYPVYEPVYTITFDSNGGSDIEPLNMYTGVTFDMGSTDSFRPIKDGSNFLGWYNSNDELVNSLLYENLSEDVTLYAKWLYNDIEITNLSENLIEIVLPFELNFLAEWNDAAMTHTVWKKIPLGNESYIYFEGGAPNSLETISDHSATVYFEFATYRCSPQYEFITINGVEHIIVKLQLEEEHELATHFSDLVISNGKGFFYKHYLSNPYVYNDTTYYCGIYVRD